MAALDLRSIEVLAAVCEKGNMTEAARRLGMTQSAVSQHIEHMEEFVAGRNRFIPREIGLWRWFIALFAYVLMLGGHSAVIGVSPFPA